MRENMALCSVSKVCVVSEVLCSVSDGHDIESGNCSVSGEKRETLLLH
jgi:hypothetical protein